MQLWEALKSLHPATSQDTPEPSLSTHRLSQKLLSNTKSPSRKDAIVNIIALHHFLYTEHPSRKGSSPQFVWD